MNNLNLRKGFLPLFKRSLFFSLCLAGAIAAPFITLAHNSSTKTDVMVSSISPKDEIIRTTSLVSPGKKIIHKNF